MNIKDLKTGMRIITRNGDTYIVLKNVKTPYGRVEDMYVQKNGGWMSSSSYNEDLTIKGERNSDYDIMKVYVQNQGKFIDGGVISANNKDMDLIWEKENKKILDEEEKRYLAGVIKPFKDKVIYIQKWIYSTGVKEIRIATCKDTVSLPRFTNDIYKGMEEDRKYTLKELGL